MIASFFKKKKSTNHNTENIVSCYLITNCLPEQIARLHSVVELNIHWDDGKKNEFSTNNQGCSFERLVEFLVQ